MEALRFKLEVPFWCSFSDFGSLNIKLTYPFPPPTALFGLIQNAMKLPSLHNAIPHTLSKKDAEIVEEEYKKKYADIFNNLKFSILLNNHGEKIEDFSNIHKGSRTIETVEDNLKKELEKIFSEEDVFKSLFLGSIREINADFYNLLFSTKQKAIKELLILFVENLENNGEKQELLKIVKDSTNFKIYKKDKFYKFLKTEKVSPKETKEFERITNIIKGYSHGNDLLKIIKKHFENKIIVNSLKNRNFYYFFKNDSKNTENMFYPIYSKIKDSSCDSVLNFINDFWEKNDNGINGFELNRVWHSTQIHRQKIINPIFTIYLYFNVDNDDWHLKNIFNILKNPQRPLYIGESDDVVNILNLEIVELNQTNNSKIHSVIPGIYENSELVKVPTKLKYDVSHPNEHYKICSIPKGDINESLESYSYNGENIVFI